MSSLKLTYSHALEITPRHAIVRTLHNSREMNGSFQLHDDEPNHVAVKIDISSSKVELLVNGVKSSVSIVAQENVDSVRFFSFASPSDGEKQDFFYNCEEWKQRNLFWGFVVFDNENPKSEIKCARKLNEVYKSLSVISPGTKSVKWKLIYSDNSNRQNDLCSNSIHFW